jgi:hypothetical protein
VVGGQPGQPTVGEEGLAIRGEGLPQKIRAPPPHAHGGAGEAPERRSNRATVFQDSGDGE